MKLHTSIPPRRDGTVKVTGQESQNIYVFEADADGELSCEVTHEGDLAWMLGTDNFYPADPADAEKAVSLVNAAEAESEGEPGEPGDEDENDDDAPMDALPVEANTPPARKSAKKAK